ncbi:MAG TPA: hypothetical protein VFH30_20785 [Acidimicrobiales bacterium]|nr:hypothetical protein [Acidimicrobiales bacterium]
MVQKPLISPNVRREAREFLVGWTLREICDLFHDHGFSADYGHEPATSGERRSLVQQFYATVDWCNREHVEGMLGVFEALIDAAESFEQIDASAASANWSEKFSRMLARDGFDRDEVGRLQARPAEVFGIEGAAPAAAGADDALRRADLHDGQGAPRPPHRSRQGALLDPGESDRPARRGAG